MNNDGSRCNWLKTSLFYYISSNIKRQNEKVPTVKFESYRDYCEENESLFSNIQKQTAILLFERVNETFSVPDRVLFFYDIIEKTGIAHSSENISLTSILHISDGYIRVMRTRLKQKIRKSLIELEQSAL